MVAYGVWPLSVVSFLEVHQTFANPLLFTCRRLLMDRMQSCLSVLTHAAIGRFQVGQLLRRVDQVIQFLEGGCLLQDSCLLWSRALDLRLRILM